MTLTKEMDALIRTLDPVAWATFEADDALTEVTDYFRTRPEECERMADALFARAFILTRKFNLATCYTARLRAYFDNRADADGDSDGYRPNAEMKALVALDRAIDQVQRIQRRGR